MLKTYKYRVTLLAVNVKVGWFTWDIVGCKSGVLKLFPNLPPKGKFELSTEFNNQEHLLTTQYGSLLVNGKYVLPLLDYPWDNILSKLLAKHTKLWLRVI